MHFIFYHTTFLHF